MARHHALGPIVLAALSSICAVACGQPADEETGDNAAAVTKLDSYWADAKRLDLGDLERVTVGFATDKLNDQLSAGPVGARIDPAGVFAAHADPNKLLPDGSQIKSLDTIVSGLAAQLGERELGTEVNAARLKQLQNGSDKYFVESGVALKAGISHGWNFAASGLNGTNVTLGFDASAELSSRMITAATDDNLATLVSAPFAAAKQMRGFVYPRSLDDVRSMKPGEMFALRGLGKLGGNFGLGAPILVAEPTGGLAYRVIVSAGVAGVIGGQLDVQLVRLEGDEVVVDVGVENGKGVSFQAALKDGWGVKGICEDGERCLRTVELGGAHVDLSKLIEKAIENRLNSYLSFKIEGSVANASSRVSLSRFRFHLDRGDKAEVSKALEQTLKFDLRLAQALYNRDLGDGAPAVTAELDAVRASTTSSRSFGFEVLGMNVYHRAVVEKQGTFVVQTPDGVKSVLFDSLHKQGGWFQMDHGFTRTGLGAQTVDTKSPDAFKSEANLFVQTVVGDKHMDDDLIIDNIDAVLVGVAGRQVVEALDTYGNQMQRLVWSRCPVQEDHNDHNGSNTKTWDEQCNVKLLDDPMMTSLKASGLAAIEPLIGALSDDYKKIVRDAAGVRLTLQSVGIHNLDAANGPNVSFTMDMRLDDKALELLTAHSKEEYTAALREYLADVWGDRMRIGKDQTKDDVRKAVDDKWGDQIGKMGDKFDASAKAYRLITDAERLVPVALSGKHYLASPVGVRFSVDHDASKAYENAVLVSTSHDRAQAAARLFDGLKDQASHIGAPLYDEHTAAFPLLQLVPRQNLNVGVDIAADVKSTFWVKRERYLKAGFKGVSLRAKGAEVSTISAGLFDLDAILAAN